MAGEEGGEAAHVCGAGPALLAQRDQNGTVDDLHGEAGDSVPRLVGRVPRADVVPLAVRRTAHQRPAQFASP
jgi:hypothetical protein